METNVDPITTPQLQPEVPSALDKYTEALLDDGGKGKAKSKSTAPTKTPTVDDYINGMNSNDPISGVLTGTIGEQDPTKYDFQMKPGLDNDILRAQNQSTMEKVGIGLANVVPNIATSIVKSVGQLGTLMQYGDNRTYNNQLIETMDKWKDPFGEIYQEHPNEVFDVADPAWWIKQGMSLVEMTAQFAALGAGVGGLFAKGATGAAELFGAGKGLTKILLGGAQVATSAALSYTIGASMGAGVFQQTYASNYARLLSEGAGRDQAHAQAQHIAAQAAATTVQLNTALGFGLNMSSVMPVFKQSDDILEYFQKGAGARLEGETLGAYKTRLQSLGVDNPTVRAALGDTGGIGHRLQEGLKQSAEGVLMHFSEEAGKRIGEEGKTKGFLEQFDELGHLLTDATSEAGALNALLGVAGGVLNTAVMGKIPLHSDYVRENGELIQLKNEDGSLQVDPDGQPLFEKKMYSSREMARNQRMNYFENTRDAIVTDIDSISSKMTKLQELATSGAKPEVIQPVLNDLLSVQQLHAITMGTGDNLISEYEGIAATDNTRDLGEAALERANKIAEAQVELIQQEQVNSPEELSEEAAQAYNELDAQRKAAMADADKLSGVSEAMQKGFTTSMKDNSYKERAHEAAQDINLYEKWHKELDRTFGGDQRFIQAHVPEIVLHKQIQSHLYDRLITKLDVENKTERAELEAQHGPILSSDNFNSIVRDYNRKVAQNSSLANKFNDELASLHDMVKRSDIPAIENMLAKYKIDYPQGDIIPASRELSKKLADIRDSKLAQSKEAYDNIGESLEFKNWQDINPDKGLDTYIKELHARTIQNEALSSKEEYTEQLREEHNILQDQINQIKSRPRDYAKSVLKDFDKAQAATREKMRAENATFLERDREIAAVENLTNDQRRKATKVYETKIADVESQLEAKEKELRGATGTETTKLGRLVSWVKDPMEKKLRTDIANLQAQADFLRNKLSKVLLPEGTPEEVISENELTALPGDIADSIADLSGQINSDLTPDQIRTQLGKMLDIKGVDMSTITPDSIDAAVVRALTMNKERATQKDSTEVADKLGDLINTTGNPELIREAVEEILNEQKPFSYDALAMHQMMGFVDQPTAAKIMQSVNDLMNGAKVAEDTVIITPDTPVITPEPLPETEETPDTPEVNDPELTEPPTPTPDDTSDQVVIGRNNQKGAKPMFHVGTKATDALKINRLDIDYSTDISELDGGGEYRLKSISSQINRNLSEQMLEHGKITPGTKVTFKIDTEWSGKKNVDSQVDTQVADDISLYLDKDGKIPSAQNLIDEVPIKVMSGDQVLGYLPRVGWVLAKNEGAVNYRNIAPTEEDINNPETQAERLRAVRSHIVNFFNSGSKDISTTVIDRQPAHLIMNVDEKGTIEPRPASKMLPAKDLEFGVVDYGNIKIGKKSVSAKTLSVSSTDIDWMAQSAPVALVPMPDGKYSIAPLFNRSIEQYEIKTMLEAVRAYLSGDTKTISKLNELTEFDISRAEGLRNFINQHYTYTNRFSLATLQPSMDAGAVPKFMFNITNEVGGQKAEISLGTAYSGRDKIVATLQGSNLHPEFVRQFTEGMAGRYKNIVFDDAQRGIKGLNSTQVIREVVYSNGSMKVRKEHASYNDYVKSFSDTPVNGTNQLSSGEHVYGVHANTTMDMDTVMSTRPSRKGKATVPPASIDVSPTEEAKPKKARFSAEDADLLNEGFMDQMPSFETSSLTLESLEELHTFTPGEQHNGKSPQEVLVELKRAGLDRLPPDFNPFTKC